MTLTLVSSFQVDANLAADARVQTLVDVCGAQHGGGGGVCEEETQRQCGDKGSPRDLNASVETMEHFTQTAIPRLWETDAFLHLSCDFRTEQPLVPASNRRKNPTFSRNILYVGVGLFKLKIWSSLHSPKT